MTSPARFYFQRDFAAPPAETAPVPTIDVPVHQALLAEAEQRGYERGRSEGSQTNEARSAKRLADEATRLASAAQSMLAILDGERLRIEREAVLLAETIATTLARELVGRAPDGAILRVIEDCMGPLRRAPHVVVRLAPAETDELRRAIEAIAGLKGFAGRLILLDEPTVKRGDCRVEWADGGIVLDRAATEASVAAALARHLDTLSPPDEAP